MTGNGIKTAVLVIIAAIVGTAMLVANSVTTGSSGSSQTFFQQFVLSGGPIVWFVLLPMSVFTVYMMLSAAAALRKSRIYPDNIEADVLTAIRTGSFMWLNSPDRTDILTQMLRESVGSGQKDQSLSGRFGHNLGQQAAGMMQKIEPLNIIGNIAPMVGLFGTVFGMIKLFNAIVVAGGQPEPAQLAEGISVALVTTFWGLLIAIPSLAFYGAMAGRIESVVSEAAAAGQRVLPEAAAVLEESGGDEQVAYNAAISQFAGPRRRMQ